LIFGGGGGVGVGGDRLGTCNARRSEKGKYPKKDTEALTARRTRLTALWDTGTDVILWSTRRGKGYGGRVGKENLTATPAYLLKPGGDIKEEDGVSTMDLGKRKIEKKGEG